MAIDSFSFLSGLGDSFFNWKELVWSTWLFCGEEKEKSMEGRSLLLVGDSLTGKEHQDF